MKRTILLIQILLLCTHLYAQRLYLSGTGSDNTKIWDFYCSDGRNSGKWRKIAVPSCWELQGFGEYTYGRFERVNGMTVSDETGHYKTSFTIPKEWNGKYLKLTFEGVMTDTKVMIDGRQVGNVHQGGFTEFSYDITDIATPGKRQLLEVFVNKESANASVNAAERRADWWLFGGIYRPVYIDAMPKEHISGFTIDARANGDLYVNHKGLTLTLDGKEIAYDDAAGCYHCGDVSLWDPEHPNLHTATFTLVDSGHSVTYRIGFRTIEFRRHDGIYLNGTKLVVKGTNRHCFHPESGRTTNKAQSVADAMLIKRMNMNAVRCHYPSDRHFLDVCDSVGLLYIDEFPGWQKRYNDTTAIKLLPEFMMRDVNHPCVFIWSNGNEGGWNTSVDKLFSQYDPQHRKVIHPWADYDGIDTHHYPAYQTGMYRLQNGQNVFMPTEFMHGRWDRGQGASLEDMWSHWTRSPLFAGAFIWAFVDEAVRRTDLGGVLDGYGENAPDGVVDPYRQPESSFYTIREVWSPVYIDKLNVTELFDGRIAVENRWLFSRLSECRMTYNVKRETNETIAMGEVTLPDIAPGERGFAHFSLPENFHDGDILQLQAFSSNNDEICRWTAPIHRAEEQSLARRRATSKLDVDFDANGIIRKIACNDKLINLANGPIPVGLLTECYKHEQHTDGEDIINTFWYRGGIDSIQWRQTADGRLMMDAVLLNDGGGHGYEGDYFTPESKWQVGLTFDYPEQIFTNGKTKSVSYLGNGPYRVWRNRLKGQQFGVWTKEYNNTITGQYNSVNPPVYPEFKGYHANVRWMQFPDFRVTSLTEALYIRLYTPEEPVNTILGEVNGKDKRDNAMIPFPAGDVSFLLSIPAMRSYKPLDQLGPLAQPDNIRIKPGDEGFHIKLVFEFE